MALLYGVLNQRDLADRRVTEVGVDEVITAVTQSLAEHERAMAAVMGLFVMATTKFKTRFRSVAAARLQPLDAAGRARPIKLGSRYDVSLPIQMAGAAWGTDYVTSKKMTVGDVSEIVSSMTEADIRWNREHLLGAVFYKGAAGGWAFDDQEHGILNVFGLADGDGVTYQVATGANAGVSDDHLKATATLTSDTFTDIRQELQEHPENAGEIIAFIPSNLRSTVEALTMYYPKADANLRQGANTTVLVSQMTTPIPGEIIGYCEGVWIAEWRTLPDNYIVARCLLGDKPIAMREDEEAELRGFKEVADREDYPWYEKQYLRRAGFGAWNRVGALVYRIGNANYAVPSGYESPMA